MPESEYTATTLVTSSQGTGQPTPEARLLRVSFFGKHPTFADHINSAGHRDLPMDPCLDWLRPAVEAMFRSTGPSDRGSERDLFLIWKRGRTQAVAAAWASEDAKDRRRWPFVAAMTSASPLETTSLANFAVPRLAALGPIQQAITRQDGAQALKSAIDRAVDSWNADAAALESWRHATRGPLRVLTSVSISPFFLRASGALQLAFGGDSKGRHVRDWIGAWDVLTGAAQGTGCNKPGSEESGAENGPVPSSRDIARLVLDHPQIGTAGGRANLIMGFPFTQGLSTRLAAVLARAAQRLRERKNVPRLMRRILVRIEPPEAQHVRLPPCADNACQSVLRWISFADTYSPYQAELLIVAAEPPQWVDIFFGRPSDRQIRSIRVASSGGQGLFLKLPDPLSIN